MYIHKEKYHNLKAPQEIVPAVYNLIKPVSVVDVGCGIGTFLYCFKEMGVKEVLGIEGTWVNEEQVKKYLAENEFIKHDLDKEIPEVRKFDLAICLEVAEHLKESSADILIDSLCKLSNVILFSAAIPGQRGQGHINEQWPSYWAEKFKKHNFIFKDVLRHLFWDNTAIDVWYRQNIFLVINDDYKIIDEKLKEIEVKSPLDIVHPEIFNDRMNTINKVFSGNMSLYIRYAYKKFRQRFS